METVIIITTNLSKEQLKVLKSEIKLTSEMTRIKMNIPIKIKF
jgi:hypothetical protein